MPDHRITGRFSIHKRVCLCGAGLVVLTTGAGLLHWLVPVVAEMVGSSTGTEAWRSSHGTVLVAGLTAVLIGASLSIAFYLTVVLGSRMRRDLERLHAGIRQLATPEEEGFLDSFACEELHAVAVELRHSARALQRQQARLSKDATRDPLTGLPNRRTFMYSLEREVAFALRTGWPLSLIMVDLDHFKDLNDTYGHQTGDTVLQRTARRLDSLVRESDVVARFGGEEFVLILPGTRLDQAVQIAQQLRNGLRCDRLIVEQHKIGVTASFGVAELHACRLTDAEALISQADAALYQAKSAGRDTVVAAPTATAVVLAPRADGTAQASPTDLPAELADRDQDIPVDRDTMALMGSTFSILQLIPDKHRVAHDVIQQVATVLPCSAVALFIYDEAHARLVSLSSQDTAEGQAPAGVSVSAELDVWFRDLRLGEEWAPRSCVEPTFVQQTSAGDPTFLLRLPLVAYGRLLGVIEAAVPSGSAGLSKRQHTVLVALSAIGATALQNCDAYERLEERWMGLIEVLCRTIHSRDSYKLDHAERVSRNAVKLARALSQHDEDELQLIRVAGLVHDVGKVALPPHLFEKKGRFRVSQRKLMEQHCHIGAEIVSRVPHMERLAEIVRHHHEHYDGGGYPDRLAGDEIPIESRILAVVDAYDAMTSHRPYRPALSDDAALQRIREASGTQFDPAVVAAFLECFGPASGKDPSLPVEGSRVPV